MTKKNGSGLGSLLKSTTEKEQMILAGRYQTASGLVNLFQIRDALGSVSGWRVCTLYKAKDFPSKQAAQDFIAKKFGVMPRNHAEGGGPSETASDGLSEG